MARFINFAIITLIIFVISGCPMSHSRDIQENTNESLNPGIVGSIAGHGGSDFDSDGNSDSNLNSDTVGPDNSDTDSEPNSDSDANSDPESDNAPADNSDNDSDSSPDSDSDANSDPESDNAPADSSDNDSDSGHEPDQNPGISNNDLPIYMFGSFGAYRGDLGGREGADEKCMEQHEEYYSVLTCDHVHALISVDEDDEIRDMPQNYGVPTDRRILGPHNNTLIDNSWDEMLDGSILNELGNFNVFSPYSGVNHWWSGSSPDGSLYDLDSALYPNNCIGWTNNLALFVGDVGDIDAIDSDWIASDTAYCASFRRLACLCWQD